MTAPETSPLTRPLETALRTAVEALAAVIVLAEVGLLLAAVVARFVFRSPIIWSDELASILFIWLGMLGAVIALQRGQHMRVTALASRAPAALQSLMASLAAGFPVLFLALLLVPAIHYAAAERAITTSALGLPNVIRAAALPVGVGLMLLIALLQWARLKLRDLALAVGVLGLLAAFLWVAAPMLSGAGLAVIFGVLLLAGVLAGAPIAFVFGLVTLAYLAVVAGAPLGVVASRVDEGMSSLILLAVPIFVFLGGLITMTGMAQAMVDFLAALVGHVRGGLNYVLLAAMYLVSGISGAKAADMAAVAPALFPEMKKRGGDEGEMVSLLAASGAMSETIPPSIVLLAIGSVTGVSIAALFTGGLLPALILAAALCAVTWWRARGDDRSHMRKPTGAELGRAFLAALPALILPFAIRALVAGGVATATEVSSLAVAYAVIAGLLVYRRFDWRRLYPMLVETAALSGAILLIIGAASAMAWALAVSGFAHELAADMKAIPGGKAGFIAASIAAFIVLGSILEGIPAVVLFGPLLFPAAKALHVNEVHYAMVVVLAMGVGLFSPPFGVGYYAACAVGGVHPDAGMKKIWPYMIALVIGLVVVAAVPWLSTGFLPHH